MSDKARKAAVEALGRSRKSGAWSTQTADSILKKYGLEGRDAALTVNIYLGVLQNMTLCDFYIDHFCKNKLEPKLRDILRTGVYQLLFMDKIPANAAVNETVNICREEGLGRASGLVNAVLRRIASSELPEIPDKGTAKYLSVKYSHPLWLAETMTSAYGYDFAEDFFKTNNTIPETYIQVNTLKADTEELSQKLDGRPHPWLPDCLAVKGNITKLYGFDKGLFYVQDPAAKCAVEIADLEPGMSVLDACAAPGGKSMAAAIKMKNTGSITSCDLHEKKTQLISESAKRLGIDIIKTEAADARKTRSEQYDVVIADVPCSGYGVIRKKPDIRFKPEEERKALPEIQLAILKNLADCVKCGGELIYSTCTVFKEENEDVVNSFLCENHDFETVKFTLPNGKCAENGMVTFFPNVDGTDGFFVCKLRKVK